MGTSAVFVTFAGNCKQALSFYQTCFGGSLHFDTFGEELPGYTDTPVVSGSLVSERIIIHGSDLVHNEGRTLGNYIAIFLQCAHAQERRALVQKLGCEQDVPEQHEADECLIEVKDAFDVRWVLGACL